MRYKIVTLSPLHIGNGEKISPMEYVVDNKFHRIDMEELFKDDEFDIEGFIEDAKFGSFYLGERYEKVAKKHILYSSNASKDSMEYIKNRKPEIQEFIKTGGKPYIPGSSIKGAIRTAIMWHALKNSEELYFELVDYIERIWNREEKKPDRKWAASKIEKKVFGKDPNHDIMRILQISDSRSFNTNSLSVENIHILTTRKEGYGEKNFNVIIETVKRNSNTIIEVKLDEFLERDNVVKDLEFSSEIMEYLKKFGEVCNEYAKDLIEYELNFFKRINDGGLNNIIDFYQSLYDEANGGGVLLRLAWGTGWHGMTVGRLLEEDVLDRLRKIYSLGKRRNMPYFVKPFPKTRKIVFEDGMARYPLGWIKLEEIK